MSRDQRALARAAPGPAQGFVSRRVRAAGLDLHVRTRAGRGATGHPWVLLHGLAVSHRYLMPTAAALGDVPVYVPDLPGFGLSEKPHRAYDVRQHAQVVAAWMDADALSAAHLLGNSFGCQVAVELAISRPDLVAGLVLVGPTVDPAAPTAAGQIRRWLRDLLSEDPHQARIIAADIRDAGPRRVLRTLGHSVRHRIDQRLPLVQAPVLFLRGQHDPIAPARWIAQAVGLVGDASTADVPGAAHNAATTSASRVAGHALAFAAAGSGRGRR
jgi:pimeloyl-ACP methyl ester carboxylesterase